MGFLFKRQKKENKKSEAAVKSPASAVEKPPVPSGQTETSGTTTVPHKPHNLGELKASGYKPLSIKEEMRRNLITLIKAKKPVFHGIVGYDSTVIPQVENAVISGQNIIFLGERGQR